MNVDSYNEMNDVFGLPQKYSFSRDDMIHSIELYPFKLLEFEEMGKYISILNHNKSIYSIKEVLSSSYLKFLLYLIPELSVSNDFFNSEDERVEKINNLMNAYRIMVIDMLSKICRIDKKLINISSNSKDGSFKKLKIYIQVNDLKLTENDFAKIRKIILSQNHIEQSDFEIYDHELQKNLDEALEFESSKSNGATLQEQIFAYHVATGVPLKDVSEYTFYQFKKSMERASILKEYEIYKSLEASGQIEIKGGGKIEHWLCHKNTNGKYGSVISEKSKLTSQLGGVSVNE